MNDSQRLHLLTTLRHLDDLLAEAAARLAPAAAERLFPPWTADAAPIQQRCIADYARRLRATMGESLARFALSVPPPDRSGVWSARTLLMSAQVAVSELAPDRFKGYGPLAEEEARDLRVAVAELANWLDQAERYLAQGPGETLAARLRRIGIAGDGAQALAELERMVRDHGLVGLRPALEQLAERLAAPGLEVAVFGRVKSGKSSLLNRLLDTGVLPTGVIPVTEVPVRIVHGEEPQGQVEFTDERAQTFGLARLAEFVSAQENPGNRRHVTRIQVELPAELLREGSVFVDTPGVGLADELAAAETWAYLPRCDLGLVLVDAAATLTDADLTLVDALRHAGAEVQVLLAKADLLAGQDLETSLNFIRQRVVERLGAQVPVHPVSARPEAAVLTERWLETALRPRLADGRRLAAEALTRKLALLREAVRASLVRRLAATPGGESGLDEARRREAVRVLGQALAGLEAARQTRPEELATLAASSGTVLDRAAHNGAVIWGESGARELDATAIVEAAVQARAGIAAAAATRQVGELRVLAQAALAEARGGAMEELPRPAGLPVLDAAAALPPLVIHRPALLGLAGETPLRLMLRHRMREAGLDGRLAEAFGTYGRRLDTWRLAALDGLKVAFLAQRELALGADPATPVGGAPEAGADLAAELRRLDSGPGSGPNPGQA